MALSLALDLTTPAPPESFVSSISTPADLLRRALTHREMRRELEMAISRAAASRSQLRAEREKLLRRSGALEAASEARGGVRAAAANDLKAAETEASARLALVAAPRADAEAPQP